VGMGVASRLAELKWELVELDATLSLHNPVRDEAQEREGFERSRYNLSALPSEVRSNVERGRDMRGGGTPSLRAPFRSLPAMRGRVALSSPVSDCSGSPEPSGSAGRGQPLPRTDSFRLSRFGRRASNESFSSTSGNRISRAIEAAKPPPKPALPERVADDPDSFGQGMRLLWHAACMKNLDVIVVLLPDPQCINICQLVHDMLPLLQAVRKADASEVPQLVCSLSNPALLRGRDLTPAPLVIAAERALSSLVAEVLHPTAHWTGTLDPADTDMQRSPSRGSYMRRASPASIAGFRTSCQPVSEKVEASVLL